MATILVIDEGLEQAALLNKTRVIPHTHGGGGAVG